MIDCDRLAQVAEVRSPAAEADIARVQSRLGYAFPDEYIELLRCSNGLAVWDVKSILLYSIQEVEERNSADQVKRELAGWLLIGDYGHEREIYLDCLSEMGRVYQFGWAFRVKSQAVFVAPRLSSWIESGFGLIEPVYERCSELADVWLVRRPKDGVKGLLGIKRRFGIVGSAVDFYEATKKLPYRLLRGVPLREYAAKCDRYNEEDDCLRLYEVDQPDRLAKVPRVLDLASMEAVEECKGMWDGSEPGWEFHYATPHDDSAGSGYLPVHQPGNMATIIEDGDAAEEIVRRMLRAGVRVVGLPEVGK